MLRKGPFCTSAARPHLLQLLQGKSERLGQPGGVRCPGAVFPTHPGPNTCGSEVFTHAGVKVRAQGADSRALQL